MIQINQKDFLINPEIAYFIGVLHSDGCLYNFYNKKSNRLERRLKLGVGRKSLPMISKFRTILHSSFGREVTIHKKPNQEVYYLQVSINSLWSLFSQWDDGKIPLVIKEDQRLFGAYLAGQIDGDGYVQLKNNKDRTLKQLKIGISNPQALVEIKECVERYTSSKVNFQYYRGKNWVNTYFYVTYKNVDFLNEYVLSYIEMPYKMEKILTRIKELKNEPAGI